MITPEDISDELIARATDYILANVGRTQSPTDEERIAAILNAAIEAGVVSPAVWNVVDIASSQIVATFESRSEAESEAARQALLRRNCAVEHWKGQTE